MIGRTIGNYVVKKQIGQGGMGVVYLAEHPRIGRLVAIKVLLPQYSQNPQVVQRFFNEAKAATEVHNEHIIDIIDFGELDDGSSYIIMEWLAGKSLADVIVTRDGPEGAETAVKLSLPRAVHIARGIGLALAAAHAHGIIHRDLKPDNIFLIPKSGDPDFVKVLDFGIAKLTGGEKAASDVKTKTGALIGTPSYMSPEQCRGIAVDARSDIYSLGVILYRMLTGRLPFEADALGELLLQHMTQTPAALRTLVPELPPAVDAAVMRSLEKDPAKRQRDVGELLREISGVQTGAHLVYVDSKAATLDGTASGDTLGGAAGERAPTQAGGGARLRIIGGVAAATAITAGLAIYFARPPKPAPEPQLPVVVAPTPTPAPTPAPTPTPAPAPVADEVALKIHTEPPAAQLFLDDAPIANPFTGRFAKGEARHRLVAKLAGYRTESDWIAFSADRDIALTLQKDKGGSAPIARPLPPVAEIKPDPKPEHKPDPKPETKAKPHDKPDDGKTIYKGTKGKLITEFPE